MLMARKQHKHRGLSSYLRVWEGRVLGLYLQEELPISAITDMTGLGYMSVRRILEANRLPVRGRGVYTLKGADHPASRLTREQRAVLDDELMQGLSHSRLSEKYGISRERVRQIAQAIQAPTGRELQRLRRERRDQERRRRQAERADKRQENFENGYQKWREMWDEGLIIPEMARRLGLKPGSVSVRIVHLRKEFGWFPKRRANFTAKQGSAEEESAKAAAREKAFEERYAAWRKLWAQNLSIKEMAGWLNRTPGTVSARIASLRKTHPDWFPERDLSKVS